MRYKYTSLPAALWCHITTLHYSAPVRPHLQADDNGQASHKLGDEAVVDEVSVLHLPQDVEVNLGPTAASHVGGAHLQDTQAGQPHITMVSTLDFTQ